MVTGQGTAQKELKAVLSSLLEVEGKKALTKEKLW